MKSKVNFREIIVKGICLLYIMLFVYAAVSKFLDFENFQVQLGQSPLLSAFAGWASWGVPIIEILIAIVLLFPRHRLVGLFAAFSLMVMFTTYIIIILNFSSFIPCSCGGILEKLGWTEHLVFNIVFVLLAASGILILILHGVSEERRILKPAALANIFSLCLFCSIGIVALLFLLSEDMIHQRNPFVRRFPIHVQKEVSQFDLHYNSYYFAGIADGKIYLGNTTAPLHILAVDTSLAGAVRKQIKLDRVKLPFHSVQVRITPPYFYVSDGTVPCIYKGSTKDWKALLQKGKIMHFSLMEPIDSVTLAFRGSDPKTGENRIGLFKLDTRTATTTNPDLLQKQLDGIFDTDGMLLYNLQRKWLHYIYYYRNQFVTADAKLVLKHTRNTIDTVSKAQLKIANLRGGESKLSAPALLINRTAAVYKNLLFVNSDRIGKYEDDSMLKHATILDIYNLNSGNYLLSFYLYHINKQKMKSFKVVGNTIYTLTGNYLTRSVLSKEITAFYE
jgi:uncharacterized membrane protein YphA (DoxX/SURF4 family)